MTVSAFMLGVERVRGRCSEWGIRTFQGREERESKAPHFRSAQDRYRKPEPILDDPAQACSLHSREGSVKAAQTHAGFLLADCSPGSRHSWWQRAQSGQLEMGVVGRGRIGAGLVPSSDAHPSHQLFASGVSTVKVRGRWRSCLWYCSTSGTWRPIARVSWPSASCLAPLFLWALHSGPSVQL